MQVKHTEIITNADEEKLWTSGVIGVNTPSSLQNAAFCVVERMLGGVEHRNLKVSQVKRYCDPDRYVYTENVWITNDSSFKKLRAKGNKSPSMFVQMLVKDILGKYLSRLPRKAIECDLFYVRPLTKVPADFCSPRFAAVPVGRDTLYFGGLRLNQDVVLPEAHNE